MKERGYLFENLARVFPSPMNIFEYLLIFLEYFLVFMKTWEESLQQRWPWTAAWPPRPTRAPRAPPVKAGKYDDRRWGQNQTDVNQNIRTQRQIKILPLLHSGHQVYRMLSQDTWERTCAGLLLPRVVKVGVWGIVSLGAGEADLIMFVLKFQIVSTGGVAEYTRARATCS